MKRAPEIFIVTRNRGSETARLSMLGNWCNLPFSSVAAAEAEARRLARPGAEIRHEVGR